jgi:hypothetical protein
VDDAHRVAERLDDLTRRVEALEAQIARPARERSSPPRAGTAGPAPALPDLSWIVTGASLIGRTLMVLGGAFLLRYLTESRTLPQGLGTAIGVGYAMSWLVIGDVARRFGGASGTFFGFSSALIAFPLFWETTLKFRTLMPGWSALAIVAYSAIGLGVAARASLHGMAVVTAGPAAVTLAALGFAVGRPLPYFAGLGLLAAGTLALSRARNWPLLEASVAAVANLAVMLLAAAFAIKPGSPRLGGIAPGAVAAVEIGLLAICLAGAAASALRGRPIRIPETLQLALAFALCCGGFWLLRATAAIAWPAGVAALGAAGASLIVAYASPAEVVRRAAFATLSAGAAAAWLAGASLALPTSALAPAFAAAAVVALALAARSPGRGLTTHAAVQLCAAAVASGLTGGLVSAFVSGAAAPGTWTSPGVLATLAASVLGCAMAVPASTAAGAPRRAPWVPMAMTALVLGAAAIDLLVGDAPAASVRSSVLRTAVLSISAIAVAGCARLDRFRGAKRLLAPLLLAGGAKLLLQDLPAGRPAVLFATLAIYGATLVIAPRVQRRSLERSTPATPSP